MENNSNNISAPPAPSVADCKRLRVGSPVKTSINGVADSLDQDLASRVQHSIVGLGNPLLDISADVDQKLLDKYAIKVDNAILAEDSHLPLYQEMIEKYNPMFVAGGATQNSIRVAQWMLNKVSKNCTAFFGAVGKDEHAKRLKECAAKDGVLAHYMEHDAVPTGTCACCILDTERSLVANLSASKEFKVSHLDDPVSKEIIEKAQFFYTSGFHAVVSPESMLKLAQHAHDNNKTFLLNLSATYIIEFFTKPLMDCIDYADYVFGNETEAKVLAKVKGWEEDVETVALRLAQLPKKSGVRCRTVVFTQGSSDTIVVHQGQVLKFSVSKLDRKLIIDTNGAGDAFVGGFLSRLALGRSLADCIHAGHWAAQVVIQNSGCTFPSECDYLD